MWTALGQAAACQYLAMYRHRDQTTRVRREFNSRSRPRRSPSCRASCALGGGVVIKLGDEVLGSIGAAGAPGAKLDAARTRARQDPQSVEETLRVKSAVSRLRRECPLLLRSLPNWCAAANVERGHFRTHAPHKARRGLRWCGRALGRVRRRTLGWRARPTLLKTQTIPGFP